eukprot:4001170-Pleurochrysis_carterae.AAC.3
MPRRACVQSTLPKLRTCSRKELSALLTLLPFYDEGGEPAAAARARRRERAVVVGTPVPMLKRLISLRLSPCTQ